ncbi:MAG TPA: peptidoglycan DD-metalloendopeptidase family protein [Anaeromyxobacteraceae bacterium]|nr:peptidoglycan DD-metalloendopeptidase family protein [Anaeromyxobacteraceae bacterium]
MAPLSAPGPDLERARVHAAAQALETLFVKQLVVSSKAFGGGDSAGSAVRADMFAQTLAEALVKGGGIGLTRELEESVLPRTEGGQAATPAPLAPLPLSNATPSPPALPTITSPYGLRQDPFDGHMTRHEGVDLRAAEGTPIQAAASGVVRRAGLLGGYGEAVEIDHGGGLTTLYAHASELLVKEGDSVTPGQAIARVGHSGRATGPHLHFEVRQDGKAADPVEFLTEQGGSRPFVSPLLAVPATSPPAEPPLGVATTPYPRTLSALKIYGLRAEETSESGP